jgi:hypothetical protein
MKAAIERAAKVVPSAPDEPNIQPTGMTSTETHTNIVVNQKFVEANFVPATAK